MNKTVMIFLDSVLMLVLNVSNVRYLKVQGTGHEHVKDGMKMPMGMDENERQMLNSRKKLRSVITLLRTARALEFENL